MSKAHDLTTGPITSNIFKLSWPLVAANLIQSLYNIADTFWLGKLGPLAINAPTLSWPVIFLVISFAGGFGMAGTSFVSQHHGANEEDMVGEAVGQTLLIMIFFSVGLSLVGFFLTDSIVRWMGASKNLIPLATIFMKTMFLSTPFIFGAMIYSSLLRGYGDTITPMKISFYSVITNMILDPILIFGLVGFPKLGVFGAALATMITRGIFTVYAFYLLLSGKNGLKVVKENFIPKWKKLSQIFKVGLPLGISQSGQAIGFVLMTAIIASFGNYTLAAFGIGNRIISLATMFSMGVSGASAAIIGQNLGAQKVKRAEKTVKNSLLLNVIIMAGISSLMILFRYQLMEVFISNKKVIAQGTQLMTIIALFMPFFAFMQSIMAAFNGSGHTVESMWMMISRLWFMRIPLLFLLGWTFKLGSNGIWWAMGLSNAGAAFLAFIFYLPGNWKTPKAMFKRENVN